MDRFAKSHRQGQNSELLSGFLSAFSAAPQRKPCAKCMATQIGRLNAPGNGGRAVPVSSLSILPRCGSSAAERLPATPPVTAWRGMVNLAGRWITLPQRPAFFDRGAAYAAG